MSITNKLKNELKLTMEDEKFLSKFPELKIAKMMESNVLFCKVKKFHSFSFTDKADLMKKSEELYETVRPEFQQIIKDKLRKL